MPHPLPPHALRVPVFPFRGLAALAARAPIGGAREVALACFVAARLAAELMERDALPEAGRAARSVAAKGWLGTLALPAAVRAPLARCIELAGAPEGEPRTLATELESLERAAATYLDAPSRAELAALAASMAA